MLTTMQQPNPTVSTPEECCQKNEQVKEKAVPPFAFASAKLQKIWEFVYLVGQDSKGGWSVGSLYSFYFPKTANIAEVVKTEFADCEDKLACKTMLEQLQSFVTEKLDTVLEEFSATRNTSEDAEHVIGLVKLAVDVQNAGALIYLDGKSLAISLDKFYQLVAQLCPSSTLKQHAVRQKLVVDNSRRKMTANRSNGVIVFEKDYHELTYHQKLEEQIERILKKDFRLRAIMTFSNIDPPKQLVLSNETFQRAVDGLVIATLQVDMRIKEHVLLVVKLVFLHVADHQEAMRNFFEREALENPEEHAPNFRKYYRQFDTEMTQILNGITDYDSFCLTAASEENNKTVRRLGFLLMIAPQPAIRLILLFCVKSKPLIPSVLWILCCLLPFFELRVLPTQFQSKHKELYIITQFRRFLGGDESIDMSNEQDRNTLEYLLLVLTKTQYKEKGLLSEKIISQHPLFDATELLRDFVCDNLTRSFHLDFTLALFYKMMQVHGGKEWKIFWADHDFSTETVKGIDPAILISLLVDVYKRENGNSRVQNTIVNILCSLGSKFKMDQVRIQKSAFVLNKLNIFDWCLKYYICYSMREMLVNYKPEIPSVLYNALSYTAKQQFLLIERLEECSEMEDFTKSIFELAMVSSDCTLQLMQCGFEHPPAEIDDVVVADALLCSVRTNTPSKTIQKLMPVIGGLLDLMVVDGPKKSTIVSRPRTDIKKLKIIKIFFQAVKLYIINNLGGEEKLSADRFGEEAAVILQAFCENTLQWLTIDLAPLKDKKEVFSVNAMNFAAEQQVVQTLGDLQNLLFDVNFLGYRLCSAPIALNNVNREILSLFSHAYKQYFGFSLDAVVSEQANLENQKPNSGSNTSQMLNNVVNLAKGTSQKTYAKTKLAFSIEHAKKTFKRNNPKNKKRYSAKAVLPEGLQQSPQSAD